MKHLILFSALFFWQLNSYCQVEFVEQIFEKQTLVIEDCDIQSATYNFRYPNIQIEHNEEFTRLINDSIEKIVFIEIDLLGITADSLQKSMDALNQKCDDVWIFEENYEIIYSISTSARFQSVVIEQSYSWTPGNGQTFNYSIHCFNIIDSSLMVSFDELFESEKDKQQLDSLVIDSDSNMIVSTFEDQIPYYFSVQDFSFSEHNLIFYFVYDLQTNREYWGKIEIPIKTILKCNWESPWFQNLAYNE